MWHPEAGEAVAEEEEKNRDNAVGRGMVRTAMLSHKHHTLVIFSSMNMSLGWELRSLLAPAEQGQASVCTIVVGKLYGIRLPA